MRRLRRLSCAVASTSLTFGVLFAGGLFLAIGTGSGQELVRQQTETIVADILGADVSAQFGRQSIGFAEDGNLAIEWSDIRLMRTGMPRSRVETVKVGLRILPLLTGRILFKTIEVHGGKIDLTGYRSMLGATRPGSGAQFFAIAPVPTLPRRSERWLAVAEKQLATLQRVGIERVLLSDIEVIASLGRDGDPVTASLEKADFGLFDSRALTATAAIRVLGTTVDLTGGADYDPDAARLKSLHLAAGPVLLRDVIPTEPNDPTDSRPIGIDAPASLALSIDSRPEDGARVATLSAELGAGAVQAGRGHAQLERVKAGFRYVEGEDAVELVDTQVDFDGASFGLDGRIAALYDRPTTGEFNGVGFSLQTRGLTSTVAGKKAEAGLLIYGRTDIAGEAVTLSKLALQTGRGTLGGSGVFRYGAPDAMTALALSAENLAAADVKAFWPFNLAVNTRRWVLSHLGDDGRVTTGNIALNLRHDRLGPAFQPGSHPDPAEMDLAFTVEGASAKTVGALPALTDAKGTIHTSGGDTMIAISEAKVEGLPNIFVSPSSIAFLRSPADARQEIDGSVALEMHGEVQDLLAIAARKPLDALRSLPFKPENASGKASVTATLPFFLGDAVPKDKQFGAWSVAVELDQAGLSVPFEGRTLSALSGPVKIEPGLATGTLTGSIDAIPATIDFVQPFNADDKSARRLNIGLSLGNDETAKLAPALSEIVDGPMKAELTRNGGDTITASVNLTDTSLKLPWIGWRKGKGVAAKLGFDIAPVAGGTDLKNVSLKGEGFSASGDVSTDKDGIKSARLGEVVLNTGDDIDVSVDRVTNGYSIRVDGKRFDARPFLNDLKANLGAKAANPTTSSKRQIDVDVALDTLLGFGNQSIAGFQLNYAGSGGRIAALSISGSSRSGGFTADMSPRGDDRSIQLRAPDAGLLAAFTGLYPRMEGGQVALDLLGSTDRGYRGSLKAENFTLVDEPRLSSLVGSQPTPNSTSLSQAVGKDLRTERAYFDHASVSVDYGKNGLRVENGIIRGPVFGSSFSGTLYDAANRIDIVGSFMPAYGLNRIFGAIPVVGQILGNGNEGGLIGITYRLDGAFASPTLTVNPISAIAPGIFRSIFAYQ